MIAGILGKPADQRVFVRKRSGIGLPHHSYNIKNINCSLPQHIGQSATATSRHRRDMTSDV